MNLEQGDPVTPATTAGPEIARFENVSRLYQMETKQVAALTGVSFSFERGGFYAVTGKSGSGKSTMLNVLGCLDRATDGRYLFDGADASEMDDDALSELRLRHLGFIFQSFNLIPQLSVRENIELPLHYAGRERGESARRAGELAELVGLAERLSHRPAELSGGEQQRVSIARALANDPQLLLADEPTGNLDTTTGDEIMALLGDLHRQGRTIVMVTHELEIAAHANRRLHMRDGRIESEC